MWLKFSHMSLSQPKLVFVFLTGPLQQTEGVSVTQNSAGWSCCPLLRAEAWPGTV